MGIGRIRNDFQVGLDLDIAIFKRLVEELPSMISEEYKNEENYFVNEIEKRKRVDPDSVKPLEDYYDNLNLDEERETMINFLYKALVLVIHSYYEKKLKELEDISQRFAKAKGSDGDTYTAKSIRNIVRNIGCKNCKENEIAGQLRMNFSKKRNFIAHEMDYYKTEQKQEIPKDFLMESLGQIHDVLDGFAIKINRITNIDKR